MSQSEMVKNESWQQYVKKADHNLADPSEPYDETIAAQRGHGVMHLSTGSQVEDTEIKNESGHKDHLGGNEGANIRTTFHENKDKASKGDQGQDVEKLEERESN